MIGAAAATALCALSQLLRRSSMLRGGGAASRSTAIPVRATKVCSHPVQQKWRPRGRGGHASDLWVPSGIRPTTRTKPNSNAWRATPRTRSLHSHAHDVERVPRSQTRFRDCSESLNLRVIKSEPYTPGQPPGSEPVQPPRLAGVWTVADTQTQRKHVRPCPLVAGESCATDLLFRFTGT